MQHYEKASETFLYGNVCENLHFLEKPQPSFDINFSKEECEQICDGVLQNGLKQAYVFLL